MTCHKPTILCRVEVNYCNWHCSKFEVIVVEIYSETSIKLTSLGSFQTVLIMEVSLVLRFTVMTV